MIYTDALTISNKIKFIVDNIDLFINKKKDYYEAMSIYIDENIHASVYFIKNKRVWKVEFIEFNSHLLWVRKSIDEVQKQSPGECRFTSSHATNFNMGYNGFKNTNIFSSNEEEYFMNSTVYGDEELLYTVILNELKNINEQVFINIVNDKSLKSLDIIYNFVKDNK